MQNSHQYRITLHGVSMNDHMMKGTEQFSSGFIDSGTTFAYLPSKVYNIIRTHFELFCETNSCNVEENICFDYDESIYVEGPLKFFEKFPNLKFKLISTNSTLFDLVWYPSEYLYRKVSDKYCIAAEQQNGDEIMIGGTLLRQHNFVFDIDNSRVGIAHAVCS
jgi:hypothetical protein